MSHVSCPMSHVLPCLMSTCGGIQWMSLEFPGVKPLPMFISTDTTPQSETLMPAQLMTKNLHDLGGMHELQECWRLRNHGSHWMAVSCVLMNVQNHSPPHFAHPARFPLMRPSTCPAGFEHTSRRSTPIIVPNNRLPALLTDKSLARCSRPRSGE